MNTVHFCNTLQSCSCSIKGEWPHRDLCNSCSFSCFKMFSYSNKVDWPRWHTNSYYETLCQFVHTASGSVIFELLNVILKFQSNVNSLVRFKKTNTSQNYVGRGKAWYNWWIRLQGFDFLTISPRFKTPPVSCQAYTCQWEKYIKNYNKYLRYSQWVQRNNFKLCLKIFLSRHCSMQCLRTLVDFLSISD